MERLNEVLRARRSVNITDDVENITGIAQGPSATGANATPTPSAEARLTTHRIGRRREQLRAVTAATTDYLQTFTVTSAPCCTAKRNAAVVALGAEQV